MRLLNLSKAFWGFALTFSLGIPCLAQSSPTSESQTPQTRDFQDLSKGQALFREYLSSYRGSGPKGAGMLEEIAATGLVRSAGNVASLREALASNIALEEKIALIRLLGRQYSTDDITGANQLIAADLKNLASSHDTDLARASVLAFSRTGFPSGFEDVLANARSRGVIDADTYFGEFAHVLPFAPIPDQERLADSLRNSRNEYASQIAAMLVNSGWPLRTLSSVSRASIVSLLEQSEPKFSPAIGQFDFVEAVRYSAWLRALATLRASDFNKQGAELIMTKLSDSKTDPRKIMAFMASEYGAGLVKQIGSKERFAPLLQRIDLYSRQNPQNTDMRAIVLEVSAMLS